MGDLTIAIDKLDKIGRDGVEDELRQRGFSDSEITAVAPLFGINGAPSDVLAVLENALSSSEIGLKGVNELRTVVAHIDRLGLQSAKLVIDPTLARGLDYYTGAIFEVKVSDAPVGSICGGGRYDDLTGIFGLKGLSGVGISFGADRIYDVMEHFELFPTNADVSTEVLIVNFEAATEGEDLALAEALRSAGIRCELYPEPAKLKKQMKYANDKHIPYVVLAGEEERAKGVVTLKNMISGDQQELAPSKIAAVLRSN